MDAATIEALQKLAALGWPGGVIGAAYLLQRWRDQRPPDPANALLTGMSEVKSSLDRLHKDLETLRADQKASAADRASLNSRLAAVEAVQRLLSK